MMNDKFRSDSLSASHKINMRFSVIALMYLQVLYVKLTQGQVQHETEDSSSNRKSIFLDKARFITFNKEANKIRVEAAFAVPFLTIPVGRDLSSSPGTVSFPNVDVNLKAVIIVAGIFILIYLIIPKLLSIFLPTTFNDYDSFSDLIGNAKTIDSTMRNVMEAFDKYDIDVTSCAQKAVCWTLNNAVVKVQEGNANGVEKLLNALSSMSYLQHIIEDTWLWKLLKITDGFPTHMDNNICEKFIEKCTISGSAFSQTARSMLAFIKNKEFI